MGASDWERVRAVRCESGRPGGEKAHTPMGPQTRVARRRHARPHRTRQRWCRLVRCESLFAHGWQHLEHLCFGSVDMRKRDCYLSSAPGPVRNNTRQEKISLIRKQNRNPLPNPLLTGTPTTRHARSREEGPLLSPPPSRSPPWCMLARQAARRALRCPLAATRSTLLQRFHRLIRPESGQTSPGCRLERWHPILTGDLQTTVLVHRSHQGRASCTRLLVRH